ncbi:Isoleucine--tRNA ligase [Candidatus Gugararchaeum adminiculabundum]|nr:Isoleucine--tRNA ligase [Candidatus Gugararchaeum adminiculabundum]
MYWLLGSGVVLNNEIPYKSLLMHGFFVDENGEKMSKSLGNFVPLEEILDKYGADTFRMWCLSSTVWDDLKFNWDEIKEANRALSILSNLESFMQRFYVAPEKEEKEIGRRSEKESDDEKKNAGAKARDEKETKYGIEDLWLLSRLNTLIEECTRHFDEYETHMVARKCRQFIVEDLSRFYLKVAKKRIAAGENPETVSKVLFVVLFDVLRLMTPITPFIAESFYQEFYAKHKEKESISLFSWPRFEPKYVDPLLENQMEIVNEMVTALSNARQSAKIKLRWPVEEVIVVTKSTDAAAAARRLSGTIKILANVKNVKVEEKIASTLTLKPVHSKLGPVFKKDAKKAADAIEKADPVKLKKELEGEKKKAKVEEFEITPEMVAFDEVTEGYAGAQFSAGTAYVKTAINEALLSEAMAREVSRRIQMMRKEMGLVEKDLIEVNVSCEKELLALIEKREGEIASEVKAGKLKVSEKPMEIKQAHEKDWEIEEYTVKIRIKKI